MPGIGDGKLIMKTIETKARRHFRGVRHGTIKPRYLATPSDEDPWHVCLTGQCSIPLAMYYECQAHKNQEEAKRLVKPPKRSSPFLFSNGSKNGGATCV